MKKEEIKKLVAGLSISALLALGAGCSATAPKGESA